MLTPGVGTFTPSPAPAMMFVVFGRVEVPAVILPAVPAPSCRFSEIGSRLPPITRNPAFAPTEVVLSLNPSGFHDASPAVMLRLARPNVPRAPNAVPLPPSWFGIPRSPLIVTPVPPLGLFQTGIPAHWAAAGAAANAATATTVMMRFIPFPSRGAWKPGRSLHPGVEPGPTVGIPRRQVNLCRVNAPTRR